MDQTPLIKEKTTFISEMIGYIGKEQKTSILYQKLRTLECSLEDKVKFVLSHWGWGGITKEKAVDLLTKMKNAGFAIPSDLEVTFKQLYGLRIPAKTQDPYDVFGETIVFELSNEQKFFPMAKLLGAKYRDTVIPIGYMLNYVDAESALVDAWEDPDCQPFGYYEQYDLYLGSSGKVYFEFVDGDLIGIRGDDLVEFIANSCGLIPYTHDDDYWELASEDYDFMEQIDDELQEK